MIQHASYSGTTRHGKSEGCLARVMPRMLRRNHPALLVFDPHGSFATKAAKYCVMHGVPFMYDKLSETKNVPGYDIFPRSQNPDPEQREAEDRESMSDAISLLLRAEGKLDASANKMILRGLTDAFSLYIYQKTPVPFDLLKDCFVGESDNAQFLLQNCSDMDTVLRFMYYHGLTGQQREFQVGGAERRLVEACGCVQFRKRCMPTFSFTDMIAAGGIAFFDGSSEGNLSRQDMALLMGMLILMVIALARSRKLKREVIIVIDEGVNARLIDGNIERALAEAAKWGLEFHLIIQDPTSLPEAIRTSIYQNSDRSYLYKQVSPDAAMFGARMCGIPSIDPMLVKETLTKIRLEHGGVEVKPISHTSVSSDGKTTTSESHFTVPVFKHVEDKTDVRYTFDEQIYLKAKRLMTLGVGECIIREGNLVIDTEGPLPMLKMPARTDLPISLRPRVTIGEKRLAEYLAWLKTTPTYQVPGFTAPCSNDFQTAME